MLAYSASLREPCALAKRRPATVAAVAPMADRNVLRLVITAPGASRRDTPVPRAKERSCGSGRGLEHRHALRRVEGPGLHPVEDVRLVVQLGHGAGEARPVQHFLLAGR